MTVATAPVLATRLLPRSRVATVLAVVGFAALTALLAQISFRIPPIEVPFTGSTVGVLLAGGVLGSRKGAASMILYVLAGAVGLPVFTEQSSGLDVIIGTTAATGGYLIGFIVAAFVIGKLAERRHDRQFLTGFAAFMVGSLVIYFFGVLGLMFNIGLSFWQAVAGGVVPFVFWDIFKALAAGVVMPAAWKLTGEKR
ncbi:MAG TPA: biotin transporter BioY [Acidimicrobiia bacterium]|nr:biotin transporter BioY [Acidimicrobiia bacterium]